MNRLDLYEKTHKAALANIERHLTNENSMQPLVAWMLSTEIDPYVYLPEGVASNTDSSTGFSNLLNLIHHALYDDGEITFATLNGQPRIAFCWEGEPGFEDAVLGHPMYSNEANFEIKVLNIEPIEFGKLAEEYRKKQLDWVASLGF